MLTLSQWRARTATQIGLVVFMFALIGSACKKSGSTSPSKTTTFSSIATLDGFAGSNGTAIAVGNPPNTGDSDAVLPNVGFRQFFSFDHSSIPSGATIETATLRLYQANAQGTPYTSHGNVIVDRVDIGSALDATDYAGAALTTNIGIISSNAIFEYKILDVTTAVAADRAGGRSRSDFRIRFSIVDTNNNLVTDRVMFTDAEDSCCAAAKPPQLVVTYR